MCQETDTAKIAAAHGIDPRAFEDTLHALACFGWHVYAPGSPVIELVEAAKRWEDADMQSHRAAQTHPPAGACAIYETERSRMFELLGAARKVAESKP